MSTEIVTSVEDANFSNDINLEVDLSTPSTTWLNETELSSSTVENGNTSMADKQQFLSGSQDTLFEAFTIIEIVMTALELIIWTLAALKVARWRRNYRNQMLMQLSVARLIKRTFFLVQFLNETKSIPDSSALSTALISTQIYVDFVIVILVFFFIKHMYDSLIIVLVKISQNNLLKVSMCAWVVPLFISALGTSIIATEVLDQWLVYLLICCIFRWPLMFLGTMLYMSILYGVLNDKIRQFARSLTVITFLLCLVINLYLFSKDVIWLWCKHSFPTVLFGYILGILMNILILGLYIVLIILNIRGNNKSCSSFPNNSIRVH